MKKKLIIISAIIFFIAFIVVGIKTIKIERVEVPDDGSQVVKMASEEILMQVLRGEKEFIDNDGKEIKTNDKDNHSTLKKELIKNSKKKYKNN